MASLKKRKNPLKPILWFDTLSEEQLVEFTTPNVADIEAAKSRAAPITEALQNAVVRDGSEEEIEP